MSMNVDYSLGATEAAKSTTSWTKENIDLGKKTLALIIIIAGSILLGVATGGAGTALSLATWAWLGKIATGTLLIGAIAVGSGYDVHKQLSARTESTSDKIVRLEKTIAEQREELEKPPQPGFSQRYLPRFMRWV